MIQAATVQMGMPEGGIRANLKVDRSSGTAEPRAWARQRAFAGADRSTAPTATELHEARSSYGDLTVCRGPLVQMDSPSSGSISNPSDRWKAYHTTGPRKHLLPVGYWRGQGKKKDNGP